MSFQFPANPKDGDVVIRTVNGVNIKGTYNILTNTWEVGELPEEPGVPGPQGPKGEQGEKGEPGQNLNVNGIVDTVTDLPPANDHILQFYVVDDTNELYFSDGLKWSNLGSPIQGPPGNDGTDGEDGSDGTNGAPGKGWYDTVIVDQRPLNYQIQFLSNDGLEFTTDNIMGPQGETGSLQVATEETIGGIKIGRGLSIAPDGTLNAGQVDVDLETTPVENGNMLAYRPMFSAYTVSAEYGQLGKWEGGILQEETISFTMPANANRAEVYAFAAGGIIPHPDYPNINDYFYAFRGYYVHRFTVGGAVYQGIDKDSLGWISTHNMGILANPGTIGSRMSNLPVSKFDVIEFEPGATVTFKYEVQNIVSANLIFRSPPPRLAVVPYRTEDFNEVVNYSEKNGIISQGGNFYCNRNITNNQLFEAFSDISIPDLESGDDEVVNLKYVIETTSEKIDAELVYSNNERLVEIRDQLRAARNLPGTLEEIQDYVYPLVEETSALLDYSFRFEA